MHACVECTPLRFRQPAQINARKAIGPFADVEQPIPKWTKTVGQVLRDQTNGPRNTH